MQTRTRKLTGFMTAAQSSLSVTSQCGVPSSELYMCCCLDFCGARLAPKSDHLRQNTVTIVTIEAFIHDMIERKTNYASRQRAKV